MPAASTPVPTSPIYSGARRIGGEDTEHRSYRSFASFSDPDGNGWLFQQVTERLPGRVEADTSFTSSPISPQRCAVRR